MSAVPRPSRRSAASGRKIRPPTGRQACRSAAFVGICRAIRIPLVVRSLLVAFASFRRLAGAALVLRRGARRLAARSPPAAPQPDGTVDMAKVLQPGPLPELSMGDADGVPVVEYGSLTCPHCAVFSKETFPAVEEGLHRHRQGAFHLPRILAQHPRRRRLRAGALPRRRQDLRRGRAAVRPAGQVGLRRQAARAADRGDAPDRPDARTRRPSASRTRNSPTRSSPSPSAPTRRST